MPVTEDLIRDLAGHAGEAGDVSSLRRFLMTALFLSAAVATLMVWTLFGFREDFGVMAQGIPFLVKAGGSLFLTAGAYLLVRRASLPAGGSLSVLLLVPGLLPFLLFAMADPGGLENYSSGLCTADIALLSVPALGLMLAAMRKGAPTSPARAGAVAGLLAGSLAASAHALACHNDRGMSVLVWYGLGVLLLSGLGALIGKRVLRW